MPGREVYAFIAAIRQLLCGWYAWTVAFLEGTFGLLDALGGFFLWALDQICGPLSNIPGVGWIFRVICVAVRGAAEWVGGFPRDVIEWPFQRILDLFALFIWAVVYAGMGATWVFHQAFGRLEWFWFFSAQGNWKKQCIKIKVIVVNSPGTPGLVEIASTGVATSFESKTREVLEQCGIPRDQVQFGWFGETNPENSEGVGFAMNFFPIKNGVFSPRTYLWFMCKSNSLFEPTVFLVDRIHDPSLAGQALPVFTNYCLVEKNQIDNDDSTTRFVMLVHELGHLCDIWPHVDAVDRVMFRAPTDNDSRIFSRPECSLIRSSRFVELVH